MREAGRYYRQLQAGAEYMAEIATDAAERATHLKMAGLYCLRAREAADFNGAATIH